jgi:hypothetical protein
MGEQVRIQDVARRLIAQSGRHVPIIYTGLRAGEKVREELFGTDEIDTRPIHQLVSHVDAPPLLAGAALGIDAWASDTMIRSAMHDLCSPPRIVSLLPQQPTAIRS